MSSSTTRLADAAAPLDVLLVDAALGPLRRFLPDMSTARWAVSLARRPRTTARRLGALAGETAKVVVGTSGVSPQRGDRRFTDAGWTENPLLRRLVQVYLAGGRTVDQLASITAAYLAGIGRQDRLAGIVLAVTVIDNHDSGTVSALTDPRLAALAKSRSAQKGFLDGRSLAEVFAWLRPSDLIWNYWVNNYLLGKKPPAFDILFWNADTTRMSAGLHADFVDLAVENQLTRAGALSVLGVPIDLGKITVDSYVVAGIADHITPWENCYRTTQLFGGRTRFILSTSGHIAALVNPPGNPKATFHTNDEHGPDPKAWLSGAETHQGSWWNDVARWLDERCGDLKPAPAEMGSTRLQPLAEAPGTYVFDK